MNRAHILVADDSATIRSLLSSALEERGYKVTLAVDGLEALQRFYENPPDLVILDVLMPFLGGFNVCRLLKNDPVGKDIPIVMLTGENHARDRFWGLQTGADLFVTKDGQWTALLERLDDLVARSAVAGKVERNSVPASLGQGDSTQKILTRLNSLLDRQLFHATLRAEITKIAASMEDVSHTFASIFDLIYQVVAYDSAAILLAQLDGSATIGYYILDERAQNLQIYRDYFGDEAAAEGLSLKPDIVEEEFFGPLKDRTTDELLEGGIFTVDSFPLHARGDYIGSLALSAQGADRLSDQDHVNLELLTENASVLLDNLRLLRSVQLLSILDGLTGVNNRRSFQEQLDKEFARTQRGSRCMSLIMVDVDHFKSVNDTYGHQQGDTVLSSLAHILKTHVRSLDFLARYGGEEFVVLLPETDGDGAVVLADHLRQAVEQFDFPGFPDGRRITISLGVSSYPGPYVDTAADLVARADGALYEAKESGRNRVARASG